MLTKPFNVYINWGAYDELSDSVPLTEEVAMRQLGALLRLRARGVRLDSYLMDAFWYAPDGAYRAWRKPHWPQGPGRWLEGCLEEGIKPGLWFSGNTLCKLKAAPQWRDSLDADGRGMCMFHGGFLPDFLEVLRHWHDRGVRVFKIDFPNFNAAPSVVRDKLLPSEIRVRNVDALRNCLSELRRERPDVVLLAYNGFEEAPTQSATDLPFRKTVDHRWLEAFDAIFSGDPRPADVPAMNFWRSKDIYSDHMVRVYERNGFPLKHIDNAGFMIGTTGASYGRKTAAWQGTLLLSLARGGWVNSYYGGIDLLTDGQAEWFAKAQSLYLPLQETGCLTKFGGSPGAGEPYGYRMAGDDGELLTVVNPSQKAVSIELPECEAARILFHDSGHVPGYDEGVLTLGAEQMAVIGTGRYNAPEFDLGIQQDVRIPEVIEPLPAVFKATGAKEIEATLFPPETGRIRIVMRQTEAATGRARRSSGGPPPKGTTLGRILCLHAEQDGHPVAIEIIYDKAVWSGLSWAVGELGDETLARGVPVRIRCTTSEPADVKLEARLYRVVY